MECMEDMGGSETGHRCTTRFPSSVEIDATFSAARSEEVTSGQVGTDHGIWRGGICDAHVGDVVGHERLTLRGAYDPFACTFAGAMGLDQRRMVDGHFRAPNQVGGKISMISANESPAAFLKVFRRPYSKGLDSSPNNSRMKSSHSNRR
jgi:hypothetical protein